LLHCSKVMKIVGMTTVLLSSCEQSNAGVTSWTNITSLPIVARDLRMVTLNGNPFAMGGTGDSTSVQMYDGVSVWTSKAAMSPGRIGHAALALDNDRALVCGGSAPSSVSNTCVIYTASTNVWTTAPAMAQARNIFNLIMSDSML